MANVLVPEKVTCACNRSKLVFNLNGKLLRRVHSSQWDAEVADGLAIGGSTRTCVCGFWDGEDVTCAPPEKLCPLGTAGKNVTHHALVYTKVLSKRWCQGTSTHSLGNSMNVAACAQQCANKAGCVNFYSNGNQCFQVNGMSHWSCSTKTEESAYSMYIVQERTIYPYSGSRSCLIK